MKKIVAVVTLCAWLLSVVPASMAQRRTGSFADRPLDTSKRLYVRKSGTRVYSDPAPPRKRVYRFRDSRGRLVTRYGGTGRLALPKKRRAKKRTARRSNRRTYRRTTPRR